jgi:peptidylprolyl isomerase
VLRAYDTEGVRVLVLERGEGPESVDSTVMDVPYTGYLRTGQEFERSVMRFGGYYRPSRSTLKAGIRAGLAGMRHGERRRVLIPAAQAFGWETPTPAVPRGADMVFDIRAFIYAQIDLEVGTGAEAKRGQTVLTHYVGMFPDGRVFEESRKVGNGAAAPLTLREGQVISGWVQGVPGMRVGGRRRLRIPSSLAYGQSGEPKARIPPNADLVFVIELLDVLPDAPAPR